MKKSESSQFPTLAEMGVESPKQIENYYISSVNYVDVLRIVYDRPEDSCLPSSRTYRFPRVQDTVAEGQQSKSDGSTPRTHPRLRAALQELEKIFAAKSSKESIAAEILNELALLEEDIAMRSEYLKVLARKIPVVE
ncbi:MAG: DUF3461 family protein [Woeseiaceae bacterium]